MVRAFDERGVPALIAGAPVGRTILGVDPGLTRCGLGAITALPGRKVRIVDVGIAASHPDLPLEQRLLEISTAIEAWMDRLQPDAVAVERVFAQNNVSTVTGTAQVAGLAMVAAARRGIPVALHTPSEVKAAITGNGRAGKEQVTEMVVRVLQLSERPKPADAADALALAICHAWRSALPGAAESAVSERADVGESRKTAPGSSTLTPAQQAWIKAEAAANRTARRVATTKRTVGR